MGKRRVREPLEQDDDGLMEGSGSRNFGSTAEDFDALETAKGNPESANNVRQMNARELIARKAEFNRINDPSVGLEGVDDGVPDDDLEGGVSPNFAVNDETLKRAFESQPQPKDVAPPPKRTYAVKVNGQEIELSEDELIERAQKVEAADRYLAEKKREAELILAEARVRSQTQPSGQSPDTEEVTEDDLALIRALQVGDEHTAARALKTRIGALRAQQPAMPNMDAIAAKVKDDISAESARKWFASEYRDIVSDEKLMMIAQQMDQQLRTRDVANGKVTPYMERFREIGEEVRAWKGSNPAFDAKAQRKKETIRTIPQASTRNVAPPDEDDMDEDEFHHNAIEQMARHRGQNRMG